MFVVVSGGRSYGGGLPVMIAPRAYCGGGGGMVLVQTNMGLIPMNVPFGGYQSTISKWQCKYCLAGPFDDAESCLVRTQSDAYCHTSSCQRRIQFEEQKERDLNEQRRLERVAAEARRKVEEASRKEAELRNAVNNIDHLRF